MLPKTPPAQPWDEVQKGTRDYAKRASDLPCPHCGTLMDTFNYRAHNLSHRAVSQRPRLLRWTKARKSAVAGTSMKQRSRDLLEDSESNRGRNGPASWNGEASAVVSSTASKTCSAKVGGVPFQRSLN